MLDCYKEGDFGRYFKENMNAIGMPVPSGLFETYTQATTTAAAIVGTLHTLGAGATAAELFGATVAAEKLLVLAGIGAVAYVGAVVGSLAVATGRVFGCGSQISDMFVFIRQHDLQFPGWERFYQMNQEVLDSERTHRIMFAARSRTQVAAGAVA